MLDAGHAIDRVAHRPAHSRLPSALARLTFRIRYRGRSLELRVIVDIIAGASAGGINGTMLARALSHDLPMEALRELWLKNADVDVLLSAEARLVLLKPG